jgi:hypothetical protein
MTRERFLEPRAKVGASRPSGRSGPGNFYSTALLPHHPDRTATRPFGKVLSSDRQAFATDFKSTGTALLIRTHNFAISPQPLGCFVRADLPFTPPG